jgi:uncharacterized protein (TIGR02246 family)
MKRVRTAVGRALGLVVLVGFAAQGAAMAQATPDAEFKKIADAFSQAWAKGDAKAIAALHTADAVRAGGTGVPTSKGTAAIEKAIADAIAGPFKGTTLTLTDEAFVRVTADTYVGHGTYQITGGSPPPGTPTGGQYLNTMVREGGRWLVAASAVMPAMTPK